MTPAPDLSERMASLARDLRSQPDHEATLHHVVDAARDLIEGCDSAGVSLATRNGEIETSACTSDLTRQADQLQQELGEGPCMDAAWEERLVSSPDLATDPRWPRWGPAAVERLGVRSLACVQLFTHEDRLGALNLFSRSAGGFSADDRDEALAVAAHAAVALMAAAKIGQLDTALTSRTVIAEAVGLTAATYGMSMAQSFALLRRLSSERETKVRLVAEQLVRAHDDGVSR